jgi:enoyl-CoA hydratase/carnithine racemase
MVQVDTPTIKTQEQDEYIKIILNRPDKRNAVNVEMAKGLHQLFKQLHENPDKGVLLTGEGQATCAGADTDIVREGSLSKEDVQKLSDIQHQIYHMIQMYTRPTVAAGKGAVIGTGFTYLVECDFAVVGENTRLHYNETELGMFADRLPKMLLHAHGAQVAREVVLKSNPIDPQRALELGLVTEVVPEEEVESTADELVKELSNYENKIVEDIIKVLRYDINEESERRPIVNKQWGTMNYPELSW